MPKIKKINVEHDFSAYPAGRYARDGEFTGEAFRERVLVPALIEFEVVEVDLDGPLGYGSSFLEEAFGGLVREHDFSASDLSRRLNLTGQRKNVISSIRRYIDEAEAHKSSEK